MRRGTSVEVNLGGGIAPPSRFTSLCRFQQRVELGGGIRF